MRVYDGRVTEVRLDQGGQSSAWVTVQDQVSLEAGQYFLASSAADTCQPLAVPLFPAEIAQDGFLTAPPLPSAWGPGMRLNLRGPLGNGFKLPHSASRLALGAFGESPARLMPLAAQALQKDFAVALFCDAIPAYLPSALEAHPLSELHDGLNWADFLALDLSLEDLPRLRSTLGLEMRRSLPCPARALLYTAMPCGGLARCGVCAVPTHRGYLLACEDGPVFDLNKIEF